MIFSFLDYFKIPPRPSTKHLQTIVSVTHFE